MLIPRSALSGDVWLPVLLGGSQVFSFKLLEKLSSKVINLFLDPLAGSASHFAASMVGSLRSLGSDILKPLDTKGITM